MQFDGVDLSTYGLTVKSAEFPAVQEADSVQLQDKAHAGESKLQPKEISIEIAVEGSSLANLISYLDSIKQTLNQRDDRVLKVEELYDDRYWNARFLSFSGRHRGTRIFIGTIEFRAYDALAYDNAEVSHDQSIDSDPKEFIETTGGTAIIHPVFTLTAGEALTDVTIALENTSISEGDEEIQWTGDLANGDTLEIDSVNWLVKKNGIESMATVSGRWPRLLPGVGNGIKVTGLSTTGSLHIIYRNRYL